MGETTAIAWTEADKVAARSAVNVEVRFGRMPAPNALPCADCGHLWTVGERRHEYDHHRGYDPRHWLDVEAVCTTCHHERDDPRLNATHCIRGHEFSEANTIRRADGHRMCRACARARKAAKRDAAWWREYRAKRKAQAHG